MYNQDPKIKIPKRNNHYKQEKPWQMEALRKIMVFVVPC